MGFLFKKMSVIIQDWCLEKKRRQLTIAQVSDFAQLWSQK